jgi:hypothetical protein
MMGRSYGRVDAAGKKCHNPPLAAQGQSAGTGDGLPKEHSSLWADFDPDLDLGILGQIHLGARGLSDGSSHLLLDLGGDKWK